MKKLAALSLVLLASFPSLSPAHDIPMKTWVDESRAVTAAYPDLFWLSREEQEKGSATLTLLSADSTLKLEIMLSPLEKDASVETELASCMDGEKVLPGSARYGKDWFKVSVVQENDLLSIFARLEKGKMLGFVFTRPLMDSTVTQDMLYAMQKGLRFGAASSSDLLPGDMSAAMEWGSHFTLSASHEGFCKVASSEELGPASPVEDYNFDRWRWFVVSEDTPDASGSDHGLWLMRPDDKTPLFLPCSPEGEVSRVSLNSDASLVMVNEYINTVHHVSIYDFRTLRKVHEFDSNGMAAWIDSGRYIYTEDAPLSRYLSIQTSGQGSVVMADMQGRRQVLLGATQLDDYQLEQSSVEEQKFLVRHQHAATSEDWGTWENVKENMLTLPFPD